MMAMPKICYIDKKFGAAALEKIDVINIIIAEYAAQGFDLTLRQLYYQLVSRDYIANNLREYKNLGTLVSDARLAGHIDWDSIVDRVRSLRRLPTWDSPAQIIDSARRSYHMDRWADQEYRVEVWVEKNALIGVIDPVCTRLDVPYFACIGYNSQSEAWGAAQRILGYLAEDKKVIVLHLGDHDPSGKDMSRDIDDRFRLFLEQDLADRDLSERLDNFAVKRIALNWDQIEQYNPPPNPTKLTDSRATGYIEEFGLECWELDALSPTVIAALIEAEVNQYRDMENWSHTESVENAGKRLLQKTVRNWPTVVRTLEGVS